MKGVVDRSHVDGFEYRELRLFLIKWLVLAFEVCNRIESELCELKKT